MILALQLCKTISSTQIKQKVQNEYASRKFKASLRYPA